MYQWLFRLGSRDVRMMGEKPLLMAVTEPFEGNENVLKVQSVDSCITS